MSFRVDWFRVGLVAAGSITVILLGAALGTAALAVMGY